MSTAGTAERPAAKAAATHPIAKRGMFALIERRQRASWVLRAPTTVHVTFTPAIVSSVTRDGAVKEARIAGQDWPLKRSDWREITIDSAGRVADPAAVAARLVDGDGRATLYTDQAEAVAAIRAAAGIA